MATLYENIKALCDEHKVSGGKMCLDIGTSKSLMTGLKAGRTKSINAETAKKSPIISACRWSGSSPGKKKTPPARRPRAIWSGGSELLLQSFLLIFWNAKLRIWNRKRSSCTFQLIQICKLFLRWQVLP